MKPCGVPYVFQREQLWTACIDVGELCVWHLREPTKPFQRIQLPDCAGVTCLIKVKNQVRLSVDCTVGGK